MGRKVSDGKAFNRTVPDGEAVADYELYRIDNINGLAIGVVAVADAARTLAFEADTNAVYSINVPAGVSPDPGDFLYWDDPTDFQSGPTDLVDAPSSAGDAPCFFVTGEKVDGVIRGRVINGVPGTVAS